MPYNPYAKRERRPDEWRQRWRLQPAGRQEFGAPRLRPHRFFAFEDLDGLRAAYRTAEAEGFHPMIVLCRRLIPGNGRSPSSDVTWVHVSWLGYDIPLHRGPEASRPRPGSPEAAEEARLDAEWEDEQPALAAAATA